MFEILGTVCAVCKTHQDSPKYRKDQDGDGLYWANPKINPYTAVVVNFCGPECSTAWTLEKMEASKNVTQET